MFQLEDQRAHYFETINIEDKSSSEEFIPFKTLSEDMVISWVKSILGEHRIAEIENNKSSELEKNYLKRDLNLLLRDYLGSNLFF